MVLLTLALLLGSAGAAHADGVVIVDPPPGVPATEAPNLVIKYHRVEVDITDQVATTEVDQVFLNDTEYDLEGNERILDGDGDGNERDQEPERQQNGAPRDPSRCLHCL